MANKIYNFDTPSEYSYDDTKIVVENGLAKLKENLTNVYVRYHLNEATGATVLDSSGNGRNGTPVNNPSSVAGKLNNCLSFNGSNQVIKATTAFPSNIYSVEMWVYKNSSDSSYIFDARTSESIGIGYSFISNNIINVSSGIVYIDGILGTNFSAGSWHHLVISGIILESTEITIGCRYSMRPPPQDSWFSGKIDEMIIYNKVLTQEEVSYRYNAGIGREHLYYYSDKPTIKPTTSWTISGLSQFTAFVETLGGGNQGNLAYQLSDDGGVNWRYWNGSTWAVTSDQYNDALTVHTNIGSFPIGNEKIMFRAFLISDGEQKVELDTLEFTALVGDPPVVYAGADKSCYDHETKKPFSDCVIEDPDGDIEQASAWYNIEGSGWINIPKGDYGTLQEAIRNWQYTFDNIAVVNCQLKIIDQSSKETIDDMNMTCKKYTVTFNIKDKDGNHLANFQFLPNDGSDWQTLNSPFTWDYNWQEAVYKIIIDKVGFQTAKADVEVSVHTEDITMNVLGAVSPEEIADAVWDELKAGHTIANSFGDTNQKKVPSENVADYKASESDLNAIKVNTDKIPTVETNVDLIKAKTDNLPVDPTSETNATTDKNLIITEINANEIKLDNIDILIKRILGLNKENYKLYDTIYDGNQQLITGKIKIYPTATDLDNDTNVLGAYQINTEYNTNATCKTFKVKKI